jgi:hypothetical protein
MAKMEMKKLDQKQVPQVIALGVLSLGLFGYFGMTMMGSSKPAPKPAAAADKPAEATAKETAAAPEAPAPVDPAVLAGMAAGSVYNADPFRPAIQPRPTAPTAQQHASAAAPASGPRWNLGSMPSASGPEPAFPALPAGSQPQVRVAAPPAAPPVRPDVAVTGIIDAANGSDMALIEVGGDHRMVQLGDTIANDYLVRKIALDGIWLGNARAKDRYFVALGAKSQANAGGTAGGAQAGS